MGADNSRGVRRGRVKLPRIRRRCDRAADEAAERAVVFLVQARTLGRPLRFDVRMDARLRRRSGDRCVDDARNTRQNRLRECREQNPDTKNACNASKH